MLDTFFHQLFLRYKLVAISVLVTTVKRSLACIASQSDLQDYCWPLLRRGAGFPVVIASLAKHEEGEPRFLQSKDARTTLHRRSKQSRLQRRHRLYSSSTCPLCIATETPNIREARLQLHILHHAQYSPRSELYAID